QSGINDFSAELNALLQVYPNPSNGVFNVRIDAGRRLNGEIVVVDVTGRKVYSQAMDVVGLYTNTIDLQQLGSGLYTVQLRTTEGFASKNISIE
ncbi:MAG TPA: T9SS type A sorting domain-containing protein, partial [Chitinophagales bacterium]|nr:T9SS type A sorting domain-containing protein [Chitinophagales bacterium]